MASKKTKFRYKKFRKNSWNEVIKDKGIASRNELWLDIVSFVFSAYSTVASFVISDNNAWKVPSVMVFVIINELKIFGRLQVYRKVMKNEEHKGLKVLATIIIYLNYISITFIIVFIYFLMSVHFNTIIELVTTIKGLILLVGCVSIFITGIIDKITWGLLKPEKDVN